VSYDARASPTSLPFKNEITGDMEDMKVNTSIADIKFFDIIVRRDDCAYLDLLNKFTARVDDLSRNIKSHVSATISSTELMGRIDDEDYIRELVDPFFD
jgi:hypothetical protein